ncbi:RNA 2'-phosphotransferase [Chryseolinea lacunae]|uniref:Probable RNA 2'-phosphotransferase n=1 Tax=Chryseolinea lacunae TaxID=2801331 RepID=A0ABS1KS77_9BACT|nr:RNA 2'-phosphotransferase [Chryseolinea lacunae]MBL0742048.1 RNA 2'-phosphotransferase [Chryseolinea lacunae]
MITEKETVRISKFLSLVLRHQPETIQITLDENGWTDVAVLLDRLKAHGLSVSKEILQHVVDTNSKKRFAFNDNQTKIRASQGHSVSVDLDYAPQTPPDILYHGTSTTALESIFKTGLEKRQRHHVHLSADKETARTVGQRYGKAVVLTVDTGAMHREGYAFYVSENAVWLTDHVPANYLKLPEEFSV